MRVIVTGASGFVGSNIAKVLTDRHGDHVIGERVDMTDPAAVAAHVERSEADAIVHCAILNDWTSMHHDRNLAWSSYVEATRHYADAAAAADLPMCLISTDWVFDGTQSNATEATPPNPINLYGFLKTASELVALERGAAVARVMGVNGTHWARPTTPRAQDPGFGYFVASLVDALEAGLPFTVWEGDDINGIASPSLAAHCGEVVRAVLAGGHGGGTHRDGTAVFHCCGAEATSRRRLAEAAVDVFGLDRSLLRFGPAPAEAFAGQRIPFDTSVSAESTAARLGTPLLSLADLLSSFRTERETGQLARRGE
ncbi:MAG: sugar nucleotide-binding protein [Actinomycetota bacterium]